VPRPSISDTPMTGAERQARHRAARADGAPVVRVRRPADRRSRIQRWRDGSVSIRATVPIRLRPVWGIRSQRGRSDRWIALGAARRPFRNGASAPLSYRRFRCRACGKQFNERSAGSLNRTQYPSDVIALMVLWRLRYKLALRDLPEMFLIRGIVFSHEAVRDWETKLTPALAESLRRRRRGKAGRSWYHRPGRADFPHPVLHERDSLAAT
jgi:hypothetical protein